jgi:hypothetical protein
MGFLVNGLEKRKAKIVATAMPHLEPGETFVVAAIVQSEKQENRMAWHGSTPWVQFLLLATDRNLHLFGISPLKNEVTAHLDRIPLATAQVRLDRDHLLVGPARLAPLTVEPRLPEIAAWVQRHQAMVAPPPAPSPPPPPHGFAPPPPAPPPAPGR